MDQYLSDRIKDLLPMREVVEMYGFSPNRQSCIRCPFHSEKTASFHIYSKSYYCFGCGKSGDIFSFVQEIKGVSFKDALYSLAQTVGIQIEDVTQANIEKVERKASNQEKWEAKEYAIYRILDAYYYLLKVWFEEFAPKSPDEEQNVYFLTACRELAKLDYECMIFIQGTQQERYDYFKNHGGDLQYYVKQLRRYGVLG